jgi:hypothetical protein
MFGIHWPHISLPHINLGHIWHDIGNGIHNLEHAVSNAVHKVGHEIDVGFHKVEHAVVGAVHKIEHEAESALKGIKHALQSAGHAIEHVVNAISLGIDHLLLQMRSLRPEEMAVAQRVFQGTLPNLNDILISPLSGASGRAFTVPGSFLMTVTGSLGMLIPGIGMTLLAAEALGQLFNKYIIFLGKQGYANALCRYWGTDQPGEVFVHELTHVWQGHNSIFSWGYVVNSIKDQCQSGQHAYDYNATGLPPFDSFRVEAQAHVVQDWFANGESTSDPLYPYIRDNIRRGNADAAAKTASSSSGLSSGLPFPKLVK